MAQTVTYLVTANPMTSQTTATNLDGGSDQQVILTPTLVDALRLWMDEIQAGTDTSSVVTAINAL